MELKDLLKDENAEVGPGSDLQGGYPRDGLWRTGSAFQNTPFCGRAPHCWRGRAWNAERPVAAVCILHSAFRILDLRAIKGDREYGMQC